MLTGVWSRRAKRREEQRERGKCRPRAREGGRKSTRVNSMQNNHSYNTNFARNCKYRTDDALCNCMHAAASGHHQRLEDGHQKLLFVRLMPQNAPCLPR
eukprot:2088600-Rhodomonas_salina.1